MQEMFKTCKAGTCLIDLLKWWLHHDATSSHVKTFPQHSLKPRKSQRVLPDLLQQLHDTVLSPQYAVPEDLAYFGSTCFSLCMTRFVARVDQIASQPNLEAVVQMLFQAFKPSGLRVYHSMQNVLVYLQPLCQASHTTCLVYHVLRICFTLSISSQSAVC